MRAANTETHLVLNGLASGILGDFVLAAWQDLLSNALALHLDICTIIRTA